MPKPYPAQSSFLSVKTAAICFFGFVAVHICSCTSPDPTPDNQDEQVLSQLLIQREKAKFRTRRIIKNNDGSEARPNDEEPTVENFLKRRTSALVGSQVDSIFYCDGMFNLYYRRSKESEPWLTINGQKIWIWNLVERTGKDPLDLVIDFGRQHDIEVFWSMRMNDIHDSSKNRPDYFCQWKREHLDYLVCGMYEKLPYGDSRWSAVNYERDEVRDKVYRIFEDVCVNHDVDGVEMDFFRHPIFFKTQVYGEAITDRQREMMTGLIRRIRKMTEEVGLRRGRPILIAARVPDSMAFAKNELGLDVIQWLKEDLVDLLIGGEYFVFEPWENLVAVGKKYNVPVYANLSPSRIRWGGADMTQEERDRLGLRMSNLYEGYPEVITNWNGIKELMHGEARTAWEAGVNGIYTFNIHDPADPLFRELGSIDTLIPLKRPHKTVVGWPDKKLGEWFKNHAKYHQVPR